MSVTTQDMQPIVSAYGELCARLRRVVIGQEEAQRLVFITLLCAAHSLLEGVPGVGKTLLVRTLGAALDLRFGRVQFTPDLMPSDIIGTSIFDPRDGQVRFRRGPLFTDLLLADEINRASAKTQAALLEAMQERRATVDGTAHDLGPFFAVFATQNPVEHEGTYPLPEAELDRFLFKIRIDYPTAAEEAALLERHHVSEWPVREATASLEQPVLHREQLEQARQLTQRTIVSESIIGYVVTLVRATRSDLGYTLGASPRAGVMLLRAAKANAALEGRDYVLPEDVQAMWLPALRHRVVLDPGAEVEGLTADQALSRTLQSVPVPR
jgi:MoxR-like ATPase